MTKQQIIAMGGGGFLMEPENLALDRYILEQAGKPDPAVSYLPTASGDHDGMIVQFYTAFRTLGCYPSHLSLFRPHTTDIEGYLLEQDVIYVGGGNTRNMLALWREWELDLILREALERGIVLAGISAGANCWFQQCSTDSANDSESLNLLDCLGFLPFSCTPHYHGEELRRPFTHAKIQSGEMISGYAFDDGAAGHFIDGELLRVVVSNADANAYWLESKANELIEQRLEKTLLNLVKPY